MSKIILKGYIDVPLSELKMVKKELEIHKELTLQEEGCITFEVIQSKEKKNIFSVYEEFQDKPSFDKHQIRVKNSTWGKVSENVKRYYEIFE